MRTLPDIYTDLFDYAAALVKSGDYEYDEIQALAASLIPLRRYLRVSQLPQLYLQSVASDIQGLLTEGVTHLPLPGKPGESLVLPDFFQ